MQVHALPDLTRIGAFVETDASRQGFYTQDDLREVVDYAGTYNIMVVPEVEIPGHAYAAMRSYPWLCCTGEPTRNPGHQKDLYCAGKESTFEFLQTVLREVVTVFPSPYVHIGGDEAPKDRWRECAACQHRMRQEGLASEGELQAYMIQRCAEFLRSHGRRPIGWEEVLDGNPGDDAIVQWWRHRSHGDHAIRDALAKGHAVVSSPNSFCYLSFPVTPDEHFAENRTSDLRKVYSAELAPTGLPPDQRERVLGAECCIWTEYLTEDDIIPMLFPRAIACAELMWNAPDIRDYNAFLAEVLAAEPYWNSIGVSFGPYARDDDLFDKADASAGR
jgi:N-acetyl-beta-hexosaminidase